MASDSRSFETAIRRLGQWLTNGWTSEPDTTPPEVTVSGVADVNLDNADDDVLVYGKQDGTGTNRAVNVDSSGQLRTVPQVDGAAVGAANPMPVQDGSPVWTPFEYVTTTAQTDDVVIEAGSNTLWVREVVAVTDEACTVGVAVRVGFGAATLPAISDGGPAVDDIVLSHPGLVPGGAPAASRGARQSSTSGEDLRITNEVPTGGSLRVTGLYRSVA